MNVFKRFAQNTKYFALMLVQLNPQFTLLSYFHVDDEGFLTRGYSDDFEPR